MGEIKTTIKSFEGMEEVVIKADFYAKSYDMIEGKNKHVPALWLETPEGEPYADLSKGFGEFIGMECTTYMDGNALFDIKNFLKENHIGTDMGFKKHSGFCDYPLYKLSPFALEQLYNKKQLNDYLKDFVDPYEYDTNADYYRVLEDENYADNRLSEMKMSWCAYLLDNDMEMLENEQKFYETYKDAVEQLCDREEERDER